ncbi:MAG: deoxyribonuclease IV [Verrucomicrobiota bacterium]|jgi:deoxyribonuclease-4
MRRFLQHFGVIFGAHMSTGGGFGKALERGASIGCGVVQIFVKNNMQWTGRPPAPEDVAAFAAQRARGGFKAVFGHTGYLINPGGPPSPKRTQSLQSLIQEISFAGALGLPFLVMHPGAHLGDGEERGLKRIVAGLDEVFAATKDSSVRIALENTAGQGTCLGWRIEHLAAIYEGVQTPARLGLCLDTAHFFAAGFDLRAPGGWDAAIGRVESLIGLRQILAFHLNDSKTELGSRVDRHEHIGRGKIGLEAFGRIVNDARFANSPGCLETPKSDDLREDLENLATLRSLVKSDADFRLH